MTNEELGIAVRDISDRVTRWNEAVERNDVVQAAVLRDAIIDTVRSFEEFEAPGSDAFGMISEPWAWAMAMTMAFSFEVGRDFERSALSRVMGRFTH